MGAVTRGCGSRTTVGDVVRCYGYPGRFDMVRVDYDILDRQRKDRALWHAILAGTDRAAD